MKPTPILLALFALTSAAFAAVQVTELPDRVRVEIDGHLFTEYHFTGARRPYLYPVLGPTGAGMTRHWPIEEDIAGEEKDHPHHKGLWFGYHSVNGASFWGDTTAGGVKLGQMVHERFLELKSGADEGVIRTRNRWVLDDGGELVCTDERTLRFSQTKAGRMLDFAITITAGGKELVFGDEKDGIMAIRVASSMRVEKGQTEGKKKALPGDGHIVTSEGKRDGEAWGTRADWCDYSGPVDGRTVGVAIFDHPSSLRHPTWWHVRMYGLFAANPFGQGHFEKLADTEAGSFKLAPGQSVTLRYCFYFHEGDAAQADVAGAYRAYAAKSDPAGS